MRRCSAAHWEIVSAQRATTPCVYLEEIMMNPQTRRNLPGLFSCKVTRRKMMTKLFSAAKDKYFQKTVFLSRAMDYQIKIM